MRAILLASALVIAGCASQPTATAPASAAAPAPAAAPASAAAAGQPGQTATDPDLEKTRLAEAMKHGYRVVNKDGETLYCRSDWATGPFKGEASDFWIRAIVHRGVLRIQASSDGLRWPLVRLCPFPSRDRYVVGPMCCTPEREGLDVEFSDFTVSPPSTTSVCPVMYEDMSDSRNSTADPTSPAVPARPSGTAGCGTRLTTASS